MYKLVLTELAHRDLDDIIAYIAVQLASPQTATSLLDEIDSCYNHLRTNPMIYERCRNPRLEKEGYRKALIKNYLLIYKVDEIAKVVTIYRYFHGIQDYEKQI